MDAWRESSEVNGGMKALCQKDCPFGTFLPIGQARIECVFYGLAVHAAADEHEQRLAVAAALVWRTFIKKKEEGGAL